MYFRGGIRPKSHKKQEEAKCKYSIFKARNGRVYILRKAKGYDEEDYQTRIKSEYANNLKRMKVSENDEYEGYRHRVSPALNYEIKETFGDCYNIDDDESDENMSDGETNDDEDDYTAGFIERYQKRRGIKRTNSVNYQKASIRN